MAYPADLSNYTGNETLSAANHYQEHNALEAKVGIDGSAVTTSHDYKLGEVTGSDKAVGKTASQTLTNKTLTSPIINVGSDANGDMYYRASGVLSRLPKGTASQVLQMNSGATAPEWANISLISDIKLPQGYMLNGRISTTISTNNLIVSLKGKDGNDPSASNIVYIMIGNTVRTVTSALSVTLNAGTNWMGLGGTSFATQTEDLFVYLGYNATDGVVIGVSRIPYARTYADFNATSTNERYCGISNIATASSTDEYEIIGRFDASLSASPNYYWTVGTTIINRPIFETRWLVYTPTISWTGGTPPSGSPTKYERYKIALDTLYLEINNTSYTAGTSNTAANIPLPMSISSGQYTAFGKYLSVGSVFADAYASGSTGVINNGSGAGDRVWYSVKYQIG